MKRFIVGKIRDRRKYHLAEKRDVKLTVGDQVAARNKSGIYSPVQENAVDEGGPVWLDEQSAILSVDELSYLERMLAELGKDVQGLFSELVKPP